jgi:hypothetical protein
MYRGAERHRVLEFSPPQTDGAQTVSPQTAG